ncbi:PH domain-containing protein [Alcaligenes faecalis]|nr:PH domain-containing protein [Providencia rettgeri]MBX7030549.1 PH domain-containing protein [Alcaligenes faecalis]
MRLYSDHMTPFDTPPPLPQAAASHTASLASTRETELIWAGTEGQLVNVGWFIFAILFCWAVIPVLWAIYRYLKVANHRYELTNQRLLEYSGIIVKHVETLELYRVKDIAVSGTLLQTLFGRGRVVLQTTDVSTPTVLLIAITSPQHVSQLIRDALEHCRVARGVRAIDY